MAYQRRLRFRQGAATLSIKKSVRTAAVNDNVVKGLAVAAGVVVIGLLIYYQGGGSAPGSNMMDQHLHCAACGHEFTMTAREVAEIRGRASDPGKKMTCPKCGKEEGQEMMLCQCGQWFMPKPAGTPGAHQCPHCKFDLDNPQ